MNSTSGTTILNTISESQSARFVTVTQRIHPLRGQRVRVIKVTRGANPKVTIKHPNGYNLTLDLDCTDYSEISNSSKKEASFLFTTKCLRQMAELIEQIKQDGRFPAHDQINEDLVADSENWSLDNSGSLFESGKLYFQLGQYEKAAEIFEGLINLTGFVEGELFEWLSDCLRLLGERGKELVQHSILLKIDPASAKLILEGHR